MGALLEELIALPDADIEAFVRDLPLEQAALLRYDWQEWGRSNQHAPPGLWSWWIILAGRGWGKTRTGSEWVHAKVQQHWPKPIIIAGVSETKKDARTVMALGPAGIVATAPPWCTPEYQVSKGVIVWPNGTEMHLYSGEEPDQLRGPQFNYAWIDEWAKYQYPVETMDNLEMALRMGEEPQGIITTTPRPLPMLKEKIADEDVVVTRGHTKENIANLAPRYIARVIKKYEGTRLGKQELAGEILDDVEGGFWTRTLLDRYRKKQHDILPEMVRIAIAIDPAVSSGRNVDDGGKDRSNETGIVAGGKGVDGRCYIFYDLSGQLTPERWGMRAIRNYDKLNADVMVGEKNNGGDLVERNIRTLEDSKERGEHRGERVNFRTVWASRGKHQRAEPVASLHEQGKIWLVGSHAQLEDQLIFFTPEGYEGVGSPDRADAFIWLVWSLMLGAKGGDYDVEEWADSSR